MSVETLTDIASADRLGFSSGAIPKLVVDAEATQEHRRDLRGR